MSFVSFFCLNERFFWLVDWPRLALNSTFSSINLPSVRITGVHHHTLSAFHSGFSLLVIVPSLCYCISYIFHMSLRVTENIGSFRHGKSRTS
jgi:hypothetical protein